MSAGLIVGYLLLLILALIAPFVARMITPSRPMEAMRLGVIGLIGIFIAVAVMSGRGFAIFPLSALLIIPALSRGIPALAGSTVGAMLFAPVIWWTDDFSTIPPAQWAAFAFVAVALGLLVKRIDNEHTAPASSDPALPLLPIMGIAIALALIVGWHSAPFNVDLAAQTGWHHWGAYLSPVEALLAGGTPYRDFPIQYGIGPTLVLAAACGQDCWNNMYWVVTIINALYLASFFGAAAILTEHADRRFRVMAFAAMFAAVFLWTAFPKDFSTAMTTPSVAGLRFLPLAALLFFVLHRQRHPEKAIWPGHILWAFGAFWSVESAAFVSILWWPWLALRNLGLRQEVPAIVQSLIRFAVTGGVAVAVLSCAMLAMYRIVYGAFPETLTVLAYFQNPPGPLPAYPYGPVALVLLLCVTGIYFLLRQSSNGAAMMFACLIAFLAALSYYLSRSHDNNLLNLFPFLLLVVLCIWRVADGELPDYRFAAYLSRTVLVGIIAFVATFNFTDWSKGRYFDIGPAPYLRQIAANADDSEPILPSDALAMVADLKKRGQYTPLLLDNTAIMIPDRPGNGWTTVNNIANYSFLPPELAKTYIKRGATLLGRSGWLIVEDKRHPAWPEYFATAYNVKPVYQRGAYTAYYVTPKGRVSDQGTKPAK